MNDEIVLDLDKIKRVLYQDFEKSFYASSLYQGNYYFFSRSYINKLLKDFRVIKFKDIYYYKNKDDYWEIL